jgi:serine phosphatase RsbU (regulator of sigma subunit)
VEMPAVERPAASADAHPQRALHLLTQLLAATHLTPPARLASVVAECAAEAGAHDPVLLLVDLEERRLVPVPGAAGGFDEPLDVDGTVPGRCFVGTRVLQASADGDRLRLWLPVLDGTERLGVLGVVLDEPVDDAAVAVWERYSHLVAQLVVSKSAYGDELTSVRRSRPLSLSAELQAALLPPLTFAAPGLVITAVVEPRYSGGGDAVDYAVNERTAHLAILDAVGHGLAAAQTAGLAVAAYRQARRRGSGLVDTYTAVDAVLADRHEGERYATAVLAEIDLASGRLTWVSAGHPEPLLLRDGRLVKALSVAPATPLGMPFSAGEVEVGTEQLEPGDRVLLYTDGLPEARQPDGDFFGVDRLAEFIERAGAAGYPAPETMRRLRHAVLQHQDGELQDDATALLVEWHRGTAPLLPDTLAPGGVSP